MNSSLNKIIIILLLILFLMGCSNIQSTSPSAINTNQSESANTITNSETSGVVSTITETSQLIDRCVPLKVDDAMQVTGSIIIKGNEYKSLLQFFDLQSKRTIDITKNQLDSYAYAVSNDNTKIAYIDQANNLLLISNSKADILHKIILPRYVHPAGTLQWLPNDIILIEQKEILNNLQSSSSILLVNINTGEIGQIALNFPDIDLFGSSRIPQWYDYLNISPSPKLNHIIYYKNTRDDYRITLWNMDTKKEILRLPILNLNTLSYPQWSKDGNSFIISAPPTKYLDKEEKLTDLLSSPLYIDGTELFRIGIDGKIKRLTYLTENYNASEAGYSLSFDESFLAFWLTKNYSWPQIDWTLAILNLITNKIVEYCLPLGNSGFTPRPIWSPDGKYLLVTYEYLTLNSQTSKIMVVDINNNTFKEVIENVNVFGWLMITQPFFCKFASEIPIVL